MSKKYSNQTMRSSDATHIYSGCVLMLEFEGTCAVCGVVEVFEDGLELKNYFAENGSWSGEVYSELYSTEFHFIKKVIYDGRNFIEPAGTIILHVEGGDILRYTAGELK